MFGRYVNNQREHYEFRFNGIIGMEAKQDEVSFRNDSHSMVYRGNKNLRFVSGLNNVLSKCMVTACLAQDYELYLVIIAA
eukprot:scaffold355718_cov20-Prasinocladus_malaysianus.AAC.1